jgi:predicted outer membrane repeat protein
MTYCNFTNNSAYYNGGAVVIISGSALNCNFTNNTAKNGGAVKGEECTITDCRFTNNTATQNGGAIFDATANDCIFTDNSAGQFGGAIYQGDAEGSTFANNSGYAGGAIYEGSAANCNFTENNALVGGAVAVSSVSNSVFNNNTALALGGAAVNSNATLSNFTGNRAAKGGAMHGSNAVQCIFINNSASEGEALCLSREILCTFINNNCSETNSLAFNVSDFTANYKSGKKLMVILMCDGMAFDGINTTIEVYQNGALITTHNCLSGEGWAVDLNPGIYRAVLSVAGHPDIEPANVTVTIVSKLATSIASADVNAAYNENKYLTVTLKDINGKPVAGVEVSININGAKTYVTDKNGQIKVPVKGLAVKVYTAKIAFAGNDNYLASSKQVKVTVKKATPKLTAKNKKFKRSVKVKKYAVTLKDNTGKAMKKVQLTIKVGKKTFKAKTNNKGKATFKIKKLTKKGKYKATVTYKGDKYYNKITKKVKITVK